MTALSDPYRSPPPPTRFLVPEFRPLVRRIAGPITVVLGVAYRAAFGFPEPELVLWGIVAIFIAVIVVWRKLRDRRERRWRAL